MDDKKFTTCLNCVDGRVQLPIIHWIKKNYDIDYIDMVTEVGVDGILADENSDIKRILRIMDVSLKRSKSNIIFVVGHYDCLGNSADEKTHKKNILLASERLKILRSFCKVIGLWVSREWLVEKIIER